MLLKNINHTKYIYSIPSHLRNQLLFWFTPQCRRGGLQDGGETGSGVGNW
ncbi:hypothetical protein JHK82_041975 [Glycine max]|uniref:Uncharacterized protein n=2 Tax=Glycine subgen. Soja TaxID=1462606 RepID=A0A0R0G8X6_SOYBN|nr:hypothetical protein JHK87_041932 [Glycine soja]KAG4948791.1 hypothetical protein JHK86_042030 [Glycine max]KAG4956266.1 hypothetical protein JHK85_042646 [Glycine max]KAG5105005.1 hypothetical protein JHK82_041975 [Glycine max]KAG5116129.1 hypothetical protein JHK84_042242 [Glycine max]